MQVVDGGRSVVAAVTGASPSWWLSAMVGALAGGVCK